MENSSHDSLTLMQQEATPELVEGLYHQHFINERARVCALELLHPHQQWGYWIVQLLNILGFTLILSGLVYFFAFNWEEMPANYKFISIETALCCACYGAYAFSLAELTGKLSMSAACILLGIFLAVFGQIYQTGADAYTLFLTWSILI